MSCRFCNKFNNNENDPSNKILFESENFIVVPSIGSLVEGWLLIVSKKHYLSVGYLDNHVQCELKSLADRVKNLLEEIYGEITIFEHGPVKENQLVGCGVDHLHLHLVPTNFNLVSATNSIIDLNWVEVTGLHVARNYIEDLKSYLYIRQPNDEHFIASATNIPSQTFRKAIANAIGKPDFYNWREHSGLNNVITTINAIESSPLYTGRNLMEFSLVND